MSRTVGKLLAAAAASVVLISGCSVFGGADDPQDLIVPGLSSGSASAAGAGYLEAALEGLPSGTQLWTSSPLAPSVPCVDNPPYDDAPRSTGAIYLTRGLTGTPGEALDGLVRYWVQDLGYTPVTDTRDDEPGSSSDAFTSVRTPDDYGLAAVTGSGDGLSVRVNSPCYAAAEQGDGPRYPETIGPAS